MTTNHYEMKQVLIVNGSPAGKAKLAQAIQELSSSLTYKIRMIEVHLDEQDGDLTVSQTIANAVDVNAPMVVILDGSLKMESQWSVIVNSNYPGAVIVQSNAWRRIALFASEAEIVDTLAQVLERATSSKMSKTTIKAVSANLALRSKAQNLRDQRVQNSTNRQNLSIFMMAGFPGSGTTSIASMMAYGLAEFVLGASIRSGISIPKKRVLFIEATEKPPQLYPRMVRNEKLDAHLGLGAADSRMVRPQDAGYQGIPLDFLLTVDNPQLSPAERADVVGADLATFLAEHGAEYASIVLDVSGSYQVTNPIFSAAWPWASRFGFVLTADMTDAVNASIKNMSTPYEEGGLDNQLPVHICFNKATKVDLDFIKVTKPISGAPIEGIIPYSPNLPTRFELDNPTEALSVSVARFLEYATGLDFGDSRNYVPVDANMRLRKWLSTSFGLKVD